MAPRPPTGPAPRRRTTQPAPLPTQPGRVTRSQSRLLPAPPVDHPSNAASPHGTSSQQLEAASRASLPSRPSTTTSRASREPTRSAPQNELPLPRRLPARSSRRPVTSTHATALRSTLSLNNPSSLASSAKGTRNNKSAGEHADEPSKDAKNGPLRGYKDKYISFKEAMQLDASALTKLREVGTQGPVALEEYLAPNQAQTAEGYVLRGIIILVKIESKSSFKRKPFTDQVGRYRPGSEPSQKLIDPETELDCWWAWCRLCKTWLKTSDNSGWKGLDRHRETVHHLASLNDYCEGDLKLSRKRTAWCGECKTHHRSDSPHFKRKEVKGQDEEEAEEPEDDAEYEDAPPQRKRRRAAQNTKGSSRAKRPRTVAPSKSKPMHKSEEASLTEDSRTATVDERERIFLRLPKRRPAAGDDGDCVPGPSKPRLTATEKASSSGSSSLSPVTPSPPPPPGPQARQPVVWSSIGPATLHPSQAEPYAMYGGRPIPPVPQSHPCPPPPPPTHWPQSAYPPHLGHNAFMPQNFPLYPPYGSVPYNASYLPYGPASPSNATFNAYGPSPMYNTPQGFDTNYHGYATGFRRVQNGYRNGGYGYQAPPFTNAPYASSALQTPSRAFDPANTQAMVPQSFDERSDMSGITYGPTDNGSAALPTSLFPMTPISRTQSPAQLRPESSRPSTRSAMPIGTTIPAPLTPQSSAASSSPVSDTTIDENIIEQEAVMDDGSDAIAQSPTSILSKMSYELSDLIDMEQVS